MDRGFFIFSFYFFCLWLSDFIILASWYIPMVLKEGTPHQQQQDLAIFVRNQVWDLSRLTESETTGVGPNSLCVNESSWRLDIHSQ